MRFNFLLLCFFIYLMQPLCAQRAGDKDPSFYNGKSIREQFTTGNFAGEEGQFVFRHTDGKFYVVGSVNGNATVFRYLPDGNIDSTYGYAGISEPLGFWPQHAALGADGAVAIIGRRYLPVGSSVYFDCLISKIAPNGLVDRTFGNEGVTILNDYVGKTVSIHPDGRVLLAATYLNYDVPGYKFSIFAFDKKGLETAFSSINFGGIREEASTIAVQSDGKIVVTGFTYDDMSRDLAIARLKQDFSLDSSFSADGKHILDVNSNQGDNNPELFSWQSNSILVQADGKFVVSSSTTTSGGYFGLFVARLLSNGAYDNTFSGDGRLTVSLNQTDEPSAYLALGLSGRIYLSINNSARIMRFTNNGALDLAFDKDGIVTTQGNNGLGIAVQPDGKYNIAGTLGSAASSDIVLSRFTSIGVADSAFGLYGQKIARYNIGLSSFIAQAVQRDGKVWVLARYFSGTKYQKVLIRYNANGSADQTFDGDGRLFLGTDAKALLVHTDGKLYIASDTTINNQLVGVIYRLHNNGLIDSAFGSNGRVVHTLSQIELLCLQGNGSLFVAGRTNPSGYCVARYLSKGTLDPSFNEDGNVAKPYGRPLAMTLEKDGKILLLMRTEDYGANLFRLLSNGAEDPLLADPDGEDPFNYVNWMVVARGTVNVDTSGNIIVTVTGSWDNRIYNDDLVLIKLTKDGKAFPGFGDNGVVTVAWGGPFDPPYFPATAVQPDGKILVSYYENLVRFNVLGNRDATFQTNGTIAMQQSAIDLKIAGGRIFAAGTGVIHPNNLAALSVYVVNDNMLPVVRITAPKTAVYYVAPAQISITASAADPDGTIGKVEFYSGNTLLKTERYAPYTCSLQNLAAGTYRLTAKAFDNMGKAVVSSPVDVVVGVSALPIVSITTPSNNASFTAPANLAISASATDPDGLVTKVEFYQGSTLLYTDFTAPYTFAWSGVPTGKYQITAKAYDNSGMVGVAQQVNITVAIPNQLPVVKITSPQPGASFFAPASIQFNVSAQDPDGTISKVELYHGTTLLRTERYAPYSFFWQQVPSGTYQLTAKAYDNLGKSNSSTLVTITVATGSFLMAIKEHALLQHLDSIVVGTRLHSIAPNPTSESTVISYEHQGDSRNAYLELYNAFGVRINKIQLAPGKGKFYLQTTQLPNGNYWCSLVLGGRNVSAMALVIAH